MLIYDEAKEYYQIQHIYKCIYTTNCDLVTTTISDWFSYWSNAYSVTTQIDFYVFRKLLWCSPVAPLHKRSLDAFYWIWFCQTHAILLLSLYAFNVLHIFRTNEASLYYGLFAFAWHYMVALEGLCDVNLIVRTNKKKIKKGTANITCITWTLMI